MWKAPVIALALLAAGAWPAAAQPPVWVVRDADSELVLFGSVHVLPPGLDWRPAALGQAIAQAEDLWFELPVDPAAEMEAAQIAAQRGVLPPDRTLSGMLSAQGKGRMARLAEKYGVAPALLDRLEPWFAEVVLAAAVYRNAGGDAASGVEKILSAAAPPGVTRHAFETPAEQIALFNDAPEADQLASLEETLEEMETKPAQYDDLIAAWMTGDLAGLDKQALQPLREASPRLFDRVVTQRNIRWTRALQERLAGKGRTVVVVGVGHLVGPEGVPQRLRALGYSVTGP